MTGATAALTSQFTDHTDRFLTPIPVRIAVHNPLPQSLMLRLICFAAEECLHLGLGEALFLFFFDWI